MIRSFKSFSLLESVVYYLPDFKDTIKMMSSPIAKELSSMNGLDLDIQTNFIGVSGEDSISFVPDKKSEMVKPLFKVLYTPGFHYVSQQSKNDDTYKRYLGFIKELGVEKIDFPVAGDVIFQKNIVDQKLLLYHFPYWQGRKLYLYKSEDNTKDYLFDDYYKTASLEELPRIIGAKPQSLKVGRFSKKMLEVIGKKFSDKEIEEFVTEFKSKFELRKNSFRNFELVTGDDIPHWYLDDNYSKEDKSTLHTSCMRYDDCQEYFGIYVDNPEVCSLLIQKSDFDNSKITGRALVWKLVNGDTFMDRIYYSKESDVNLFKEYAKSMGWIYKKNQSYSSGFLYKGDIPYHESLEVKLINFEYDLYPFLDTLSYLSSKGILMDERDSNDDKELTQTDGGFTVGCDYCEGSGTVTCRDCDGNGYYDCPKCSGVGSTECNICSGNGTKDCPLCDGSGVDSEGKECITCKGNGEVDCGHCDDGQVECGECEGNQNVSCTSCSGDGIISCPECG